MSEVELPEEFWVSIRGISSFKNKAEYDKYLTIKIEEYGKTSVGRQQGCTTK